MHHPHPVADVEDAAVAVAGARVLDLDHRRRPARAAGATPADRTDGSRSRRCGSRCSSWWHGRRFYANVCYELRSRRSGIACNSPPAPSNSACADEIRAFLAEHQPDDEDIPADLRRPGRVPARLAAHAARGRPVGLSWPAEHGGRGATLTEQIIANAVFAEAGAPTIIGSIGLDVVGPVDRRPRHRRSRSERFLERILSARRHLVPGLLRGRRRLGPRRRSRPRRSSGDGQLRRLRPQGVDVVGAARAVVRGARSHRPRRARPQGHLLPARST